MCELCPRRCGVDRSSGATGFCGAGGSAVRISRAALHAWEEPCISGTRGSGTIFFSYCTLRCVYCQNLPVSRGIAGIEVEISRLAEIMLELEAQGAHNINLVTPTHYAGVFRFLLCITPAAMSFPLQSNVCEAPSIFFLRIINMRRMQMRCAIPAPRII